MIIVLYIDMMVFNPVALRKAKTVCSFGLCECNRVKYERMYKYTSPECLPPFLKRETNFMISCLRPWTRTPSKLMGSTLTGANFLL